MPPAISPWDDQTTRTDLDTQCKLAGKELRQQVTLLGKNAEPYSAIFEWYDLEHSYFAPPSLGFLICKMGIRAELLPEVDGRNGHSLLPLSEPPPTLDQALGDL